MRTALILFTLLVPTALEAATVVQTCGTNPQTYAVGSTRAITVDVNGNTCT